jgi:hypothetical protein
VPLQLAGGQLVQVQHNLIKRQKQHFVALEVRSTVLKRHGHTSQHSPGNGNRLSHMWPLEQAPRPQTSTMTAPPWVFGSSTMSTFRDAQALNVDIIFGVNGAVWIAPWAAKPTAADLPPAAQQEAAADAAAAAAPPQPATLEQRQAVARAANAVRALAALQLPIHAESVTAAVDLAEQVACSLRCAF